MLLAVMLAKIIIGWLVWFFFWQGQECEGSLFYKCYKYKIELNVTFKVLA